MNIPTNNSVTPEEIEMVRGIFAKMANSVVEASNAFNDIETIRRELLDLKDAIRLERDRNSELDEQLAAIRRQRDEAIRERDEQREINSRLTQINEDKNTVDNQLRRDLENAQSQIVDLKRDRDDMGFKHMEAEDRCLKKDEELCRLRKIMGMFREAVNEVDKLV